MVYIRRGAWPLVICKMSRAQRDSSENLYACPLEGQKGDSWRHCDAMARSKWAAMALQDASFHADSVAGKLDEDVLRESEVRFDVESKQRGEQFEFKPYKGDNKGSQAATKCFKCGKVCLVCWLSCVARICCVFPRQDTCLMIAQTTPSRRVMARENRWYVTNVGRKDIRRQNAPSRARNANIIEVCLFVLLF